jgi:hypothetical protein
VHTHLQDRPSAAEGNSSGTITAVQIAVRILLLLLRALHVFRRRPGRWRLLGLLLLLLLRLLLLLLMLLLPFSFSSALAITTATATSSTILLLLLLLHPLNHVASPNISAPDCTSTSRGAVTAAALTLIPVVGSSRQRASNTDKRACY